MRAIATDLDGTLLDGSGRVSDRALAAIVAARARGVVVVAATGRSRYTAISRLGPAAQHVQLVCSNGACVVEPATGGFLARWPIAGESIAGLQREVEAAAGDVVWGWEGPDSLGRQADFPSVGLDGFATTEPFSGGPGEVGLPWAIKLLVAHRELSAEQLWQTLSGRITDQVTATFSGGPFVEITAAGVSKPRGVSWICEQRGISPDEVIALGDHANDVELLRWAGTALAMQGSHPDAVAAADRVIGAHDLEGWAIEIERRLAEL